MTYLYLGYAYSLMYNIILMYQVTEFTYGLGVLPANVSEEVVISLAVPEAV